MQGPHQTLTRPLLVNAQFLVRLQFPLAYHFTLLLRSPASRRTAFHDLMSDMAVVPILGTQFNIFAPLVIMVLAMFTFFNGYARLLNMVGLQHEDCLSGSDQQGQSELTATLLPSPILQTCCSWDLLIARPV